MIDQLAARRAARVAACAARPQGHDWVTETTAVACNSCPAVVPHPGLDDAGSGAGLRALAMAARHQARP